ncbi:protein kinase [Streptomyces sp. MBT42]|uniref:serine/threonine protein kinase n=1 Tax=Streptomyces sp. MBT42 TaxID=1488373 RepID=UPI001E63755D|nr:serine/threonine protein kinase [Streptomyces sp. MBT42]MCD2463533.1 protein kinase [Streptomyces sp. MBT42]
MQTTPLSPEDPTELGGFELLGRIGHGGMGQVYLGESQGGEPAAVKIIKPSVVDFEARVRFAQEIEVLKTIWGPRIAAFLDADPEAERPWLATEYVDGPDLRRYVTVNGPLSSLLVASLGATLAEALAGVHKQGLVHRDLKPANVLLGPNGPKIIDFGLAVFTEASMTLTAPNTVMGTPTCMPPEQANGVKPLTAPVDVYALGAVLLYAATGHYPYQAENIHVLFHLITDDSKDPDLSDAPEELTPLLTAMLAHGPDARPTLPEVVQQCRTVIEAQGLKVAQARRRLTAQTAPGLHTPAPAPLSKPAHDAPTNAVPPTEPMTLPLPPVDPTIAFAAPQTVAPEPYTPTLATEPDTEAAAQGSGDTEPAPSAPLPRARTRQPTAPTPVRHSVQARKVAQQLRESYAQRAAF